MYYFSSLPLLVVFLWHPSSGFFSSFVFVCIVDSALLGNITSLSGGKRVESFLPGKNIGWPNSVYKPATTACNSQDRLMWPDFPKTDGCDQIIPYRREYCCISLPFASYTSLTLTPDVLVLSSVWVTLEHWLGLTTRHILYHVNLHDVSTPHPRVGVRLGTFLPTVGTFYSAVG